MTYRVLFVDDEPNITSALKRSLRNEPYDLLTASSADEALDIIANTTVDVVVTDDQMPGMNGIRLLAEIRRRYPRTIRMMLTGQASLASAIEAINEGGIYRFFTKPCNDVDLATTIRQALRQKSLADNSQRLLRKHRSQTRMLERLEADNPGITHLETDDTGAILLDSGEGDVDKLVREIQDELAADISR